MPDRRKIGGVQCRSNRLVATGASQGTPTGGHTWALDTGKGRKTSRPIAALWFGKVRPYGA